MLLFSLLALCAPLLAVACNSSDTTFTGKKALLMQLPEPSFSKIKRIVGGTVEVINGCQFTVKNLTIIPASTDMYWYGIPLIKPPPEEPQTMRIVAARLGNYNGNIITFALIPEVSFNDLGAIMVYSENEFYSVGAFGVRGKIKDYFNQESEKAQLKWDPTDPLANDAFAYIMSVSLSMSLLYLIVVYWAFA